MYILKYKVIQVSKFNSNYKSNNNNNNNKTNIM